MTHQTEQYKKTLFFKKFLIKERALFKFYRNIINNNPYAYLFNYPIIYNMEETINHAFTWSRTPEGHDFWRRLDERWRVLCASNY